MEYVYAFEKLEVWMPIRQYVKQIYLLTETFPKEEKLGLTSQIQRAVVSVASNMAEGCGRPSLKEQQHFVEISYGSLMETYCQLCLAFDLGYITEEQMQSVKPMVNRIAALLSMFRNSIIKRIGAL